MYMYSKFCILFSPQRHRQNLSDRDKAIIDLAKEFDFRGTTFAGNLDQRMFVEVWP